MQALRIYARGPLIVLRQGRNEVLLRLEKVSNGGPDEFIPVLAKVLEAWTSQGVDLVPPKPKKVKDIASGPPEPRR